MRRRGVERSSRAAAFAAVVIAGTSLVAGATAAACASARPSAASTGRVEVREAAPKSSLPVLRAKAPVQIQPGREALVDGTEGRIRFVRVIEDSRCPRGVTCAWAGRARVELALRDGASSPERKVELEVGAEDKDRVEILGQTVVAFALEPHPTAKAPKANGDYRLRLGIALPKPAAP
jgi:hypothetical protein